MHAMRRPVQRRAPRAGCRARAQCPNRLFRPDILMPRVDQRAARGVPVHHHLEDVVMQIGAGEIPIALVRLVQEVQPALALDPADLHLDIQRLGIGGLSAFIVDQLIHADGIAVGHDVPVVRVPVYPRNLVLGKLEDLESDLRPVQGASRVSQPQTPGRPQPIETMERHEGISSLDPQKGNGTVYVTQIDCIRRADKQENSRRRNFNMVRLT